jgi:hypothetical protein
VDVQAVGEGLLQLGDVADVGQEAQLDLGVVGADQHLARLGDEALADPAAFLRVAEITPQVAGDYRVALSGMPASASNRPEYRDLAVGERIARAREIGENLASRRSAWQAPQFSFRILLWASKRLGLQRHAAVQP